VSAEPERAPTAVGNKTAYLLAVGCTVIWGSPPVVTRAVSGEIPPAALSLARWLVTALILLPFVLRKLPSEWPKIERHWRSLALLALYMVAGSSLSVLAVYFTTATNAVLVNASQPAVTAVGAWLIARQGLTRRQGLGIGCAFVGVTVMVFRADLGALLGLEINVGDLIMLGAVVGWSVYAIQLHRRDYLPSGDVLLFLIGAIGSVVLLPLYLIELRVVGGFTPTLPVQGAILYLALFPTLLATLSWNAALKVLGPNRAAIFVNLIPVSGATLAMFFLGERLYAYHLLGAALVFMGIVLAARHRA
jgi:drug/metabolite transporter (DMT)-like permease